MNLFKNTKVTLVIVSILQSVVAHASTGETYGYGSKASALGNTTLGGSTDGFASFYNPGANSTHPGFYLSFGIAFYKPSFLEIKNVVIDNNAISTASGDVSGDVDTSSYLNHLGQAVGLSLNLGEKLKYLSFGATTSMPLERVGYVDSGEPFKPEYFNYRARTQRPQIYGAISMSPFDWMHVGAGISFASSVSANTTVFATGSSGKVSSQRLATTLKPSASPYFSLYFDPKPIEVAAVLRLANTYKFSVDTVAKASFLGPTADLPITLTSSGMLYYDPLEFDISIAYSALTNTWLTAELDWFQYKTYEAPTLSLVSTGSVAMKNSASTLPVMRNIFVPKFGIQQDIGPVSLRTGYSYRPSPVEDNSGIGNQVDPAKHLFTFGAGVDLQKANITQAKLSVDAHMQVHSLVSQHVTKSSGNEAGTAGANKIGSPGYDIGGSIVGGGVSITACF